MVSRSAIEARSPAVIKGVLRLGDGAVVVAAAVVAYGLRHGVLDLPFSYVVVVLIGFLLTLNAFSIVGLYDTEVLVRATPQFNRIVATLPVVFLVLLALGFFTKTSEEFSRIWAAMWLGFSVLGLLAWRLLARERLRAWQSSGEFCHHLVIVGAGEPGRRLVEHIGRLHDRGIRLLGLFDDRGTRIPRELGGVPVLGTVDDLVPFARRNRVDTIVIALPWLSSDRIDACIEKVRTIPANIELCPDILRLGLPFRGVANVVGLPMIKVFDRPLSGWSYFVKAAEDRVLALVLLILALPLFLTLAALVKIDSPGPVFFRQQRFGFNNDVFTVLKFRTMHHGRPPEPGVPQARRDDPRVTRVGAVLRRHSLDELPQLLNVLRGEMSIVGPRPHAVAHNHAYAPVIDGYLARHRVKPGITGWAQVHGLRGETDAPEKMAARIRYDLYYIDNWSLLLDLRIIVMTLFVGFSGRHAY
jgi:putative colanic acid biosynthesis UDP-glucose lipid carrier transferase